uniref:Uncharacterized protein n=1 Tax=Arundo donax TaxID=35708 RepID=A0A0A9BP99_ARUDO
MILLMIKVLQILLRFLQQGNT